MCVVTIDVVCPIADGNLIDRGEITWDDDGLRGGGTIYLELRDISGNVKCAGTYAASYTHL